MRSQALAPPPGLAMQGYDIIAQENLRLTQENMLLRAMQENARLAHENMLLRMRSQALAPWPQAQPVSLKLSDELLSSSKQGSSTSKAAASTTCGSSQPSSLSHSRQSSIADHEQNCGNESATPLKDNRTTVMMRNFPNNFSRQMLLDLLKDQGFAGCYDFVYLPIDFQSNSGLGYAFVNLISHDIAVDFSEHFTGHHSWHMTSEKVCKVTWSDALQGFEAHVERYRNSPVMHESVPEDHRPLLFSGLESVPFPPPTRKIRAPRRWHRRH